MSKFIVNFTAKNGQLAKVTLMAYSDTDAIEKVAKKGTVISANPVHQLPGKITSIILFPAGK